VIATDASCAALLVARRNASRHGVDDRIAFVATDLFRGFSSSSPPFDVIISNPPYVSENELPQLAPEILRYEPKAALLAGPQGLAVIRRIIGDASAYLKEGGSLLLEIGAGQAEIMRAELSGDSFMDHFEFIRDYSGVLRILHIQKVRG
jgi:release factor glutamine methyltransferase